MKDSNPIKIGFVNQNLNAFDGHDGAGGGDNSHQHDSQSAQVDNNEPVRSSANLDREEGHGEQEQISNSENSDDEDMTDDLDEMDDESQDSRDSHDSQDSLPDDS